MAGIEHPLPVPVPDPEFDAFLFAPIGEDTNGMAVSVLSGLARADLDPWQEASRLAGLPGEAAIQRMTALISALPDRATSSSDPSAIAVRLVALLPHPSKFTGGAPKETLQDVRAALNSHPWWIYVIFMSFVLGSQFMTASQNLTVKPDNIGVKSTEALSAPASPTDPDR